MSEETLKGWDKHRLDLLRQHLQYAIDEVAERAREEGYPDDEEDMKETASELNGLFKQLQKMLPAQGRSKAGKARLSNG